MREQTSDPFAKGGNKHRLWYADSRYIKPGFYWRMKRILPVSEWITRPMFSWRTRGL